jgi:hypothetical protein
VLHKALRRSGGAAGLSGSCAAGVRGAAGPHIAAFAAPKARAAQLVLLCSVLTAAAAPQVPVTRARHAWRGCRSLIGRRVLGGCRVSTLLDCALVPFQACLSTGVCSCRSCCSALRYAVRDAARAACVPGCRADGPAVPIRPDKGWTTICSGATCPGGCICGAGREPLRGAWSADACAA